MNEIEIFICILCFILCVLGILIHDFKMHFLLAGYNAMSKEERKKYNIKKCTKMIRNTFCICSFLLLSGIFMFKYIGIYQYYTVFFLIVIIGLIGYVFRYVINPDKLKLPEK